MKWFQHDCQMRNSNWMSALEAELGHKGIALGYLLLEILASRIPDELEVKMPRKQWLRELKLHHNDGKSFDILLRTMGVTGRVRAEYEQSTAGGTVIVQLCNYQELLDVYTKRCAQTAVRKEEITVNHGVDLITRLTKNVVDEQRRKFFRGKRSSPSPHAGGSELEP